MNLADLIEERLSKNSADLDASLKSATLNALKRGELVSNDLVLDVANAAFAKYRAWRSVKGVLFCGFPLSVDQAKDWAKFVR